MTVFIAYDIDLKQTQAEIEQEIHKVETGLNEAIDELLDYAGEVQVESYTSGSDPALPPGSTYERTFNLRRASAKRRTGTKLPNISGEWYVDEAKADYGEFVVGKRARQARIHRGRWKSLEEIEAAVKEKAPRVIQEKLNR